jgi:phenylacetate-coenzyme A ligase PaaK-like adenylate-forming protein
MLTEAMVGDAIGRAMRGERLPPAALAELQERKWRELVRHAAARSPFYRKLYESVDVEHVALSALPPVTKPQIQAAFDEVVTDPRLRLAGVQAYCQTGADATSWYLDGFAVMMSSGTSGQRGYYVMDGPAMADAIAQGFRQSSRSPAAGGAPGPQRIAAVMLIEACDAAGLLMRLIPESLGPKKLIDLRQDFSRVVDELNDFQPTLLSSFPYMLRMLGAAAEEGRLRIRPTRITSSGDVLTDSDRAFIRRALGIDPHDYYCSTEAPYIAWECDTHDGLHVNADYVIIESADAQGRPAPPGSLGDKLFMTNLSNRAMPLVRYEMSDQVEFLSGPCRCGCLLPRIRKVAGRVEHILSLPAVGGGSAALIPEHIDDFVGGLGGLANYQVIQEDVARLTVNFIPQAGADAEQVQAAVRAGLERCFGRYGVAPGVALDFRRVERLEPIRPGSTKVCHYWNRAATPGRT